MNKNTSHKLVIKPPKLSELVHEEESSSHSPWSDLIENAGIGAIKHYWVVSLTPWMNNEQ